MTKCGTEFFMPKVLIQNFISLPSNPDVKYYSVKLHSKQNSLLKHYQKGKGFKAWIENRILF